MFFFLASAVKRRLVWELRDSFSEHPIYSKIVPFIQQKFVFKERPQYGIVVQSASVATQRLSSDNFVGTVISHVMLSKVPDKLGTSIEWVQEDIRQIDANGGVFPTPPGVYFVEIIRAPEDTDAGRRLGQFVVDPMVTVNDELVFDIRTGLERRDSFHQLPVQGTLFVTQDRHWPLKEGVEFSVDYEHNHIELLRDFRPGVQIFADYRYSLEPIGPVEFDWNTSNHTVLPGVTMAFGRRVAVGDRQAVVVTESRVETAKEYGGNTDISVDFEVIARDADQASEIADWVFMYLWAEKQNALASDGLQLTDFAQSGDAEDVYDETSDEVYWSVPFSTVVKTHWAIHVALPLTIRHVATLSRPQKDAMALLDDEAAARIVSGIKMDSNLGLTSATYARAKGMSWDFESIR